MDLNREALDELLPPALVRWICRQTPLKLFAALRQQGGRGPQCNVVERVMESPLARELAAACFTTVYVRFQQLFIVERKLAIQKQREIIFRFLTRHTKSPKAVRIF